MFIKKFNIITLIAVIFQAVVPGLGLESLNAKENKDSSCFTYNLSSNMESITEGYQIQFNFEYESVEPACSAEEVTGQQIIIDFSPLVSSDGDISYSIDSNIFDINISTSGIVTLTFKDLTMAGETLVDFGGNAVFTITAKDVDSNEDITITDSVGGEVHITITDEVDTDANTNKGSFGDFVEVGDTMTYQVLINGQRNHVDSFHGVDSHSAGMEYVEDSFYAQQDEAWINMDDYFTYSYDTEGNMIIDSTMAFDVPVLLTYDMTIVNQEEVYHNQFEATYNTEVPDIVGDDVWFDMDAGSWVDYTHGNIQITKIDEDGNTLSGAEFDILNSEGNIVDHVVTDDSGMATSTNLPLGAYKVVETVAPTGYTLNPAPYDVIITSDDDDMIFEVEIVNVYSMGNIEITKVNEEGNTLSGAEFDILDSEGNIVDHVVTGDEGIATSINLPLGNYQIIETVAPSGYILDATPHEITITTNNELVKLEIENILMQTPSITVPEIGGGKDQELTTDDKDNLSQLENSEVSEKEEELNMNDEVLASTGSSSVEFYFTIILLLSLSVVKQKYLS
ncbi:SpaA isopeptide-forming pilin-related protein [Mollicutes bacterium LVI A0078]|nr:SpaA isopeptide-forming pilin-related protein [Mollicutes bacterium LVI A0075]WOO90869.1 SpaA isopeptide-forming pilin-related protein [Mollicutes bacterium LVI A0078]